MKIITMLLGASFLLSSCNKKETLIENQAGTVLTNSTSACTLFIQLDSGAKIDPINRDKMGSFQVNGKRVTVSYRATKDFVTPCENTTAVIIEDIR